MVGFVTIVLWRMPASWVVPWLPPGVSCGTVTGSIWHGNCAGLVLAGQPYGDVGWTVHAGALLGLTLDAHINVIRGPAKANTDITTGLAGLSGLLHGTGKVTLRNVVADLPLDTRLIPQVPATWGGKAHVELARLTLTQAQLTDVQGKIDVHDLVDRDIGNTVLGNYSLTFLPGASGLTAEIHDLGGSLAVQGILRITQPSSYNLDVHLTARPTAPPDVLEQLKKLPLDAQGRPEFEEEGKF
jgi:hypothetical protein